MQLMANVKGNVLLVLIILSMELVFHGTDTLHRTLLSLSNKCQDPKEFTSNLWEHAKWRGILLVRDKWVLDSLIEEELYGKLILPHFTENDNER